MPRPFPVVWLVPAFAAAVAGYYVYNYLADRGPLLTLTFNDATGLKPGQSRVMHLGVEIGQVVDCQLSQNQKQAIVRIRLKGSEDSFAKKGAMFWIVRPEISTQEISGLATILSGPFIDAAPGSGETQTEFIGLQSPPVSMENGLSIVLKAPRVERLQAQSPVYFRGIQVGAVEDIQLSPDAASVDVQVFIPHRYVPLVRSNSEFWVVSTVDIKGGLFTGIQMKVESLRSLLTGGIGFATPAQNMGEQATNGSEFVLHDEPKKDWLNSAPKSRLAPATRAQSRSILRFPNHPEPCVQRSGRNNPQQIASSRSIFGRLKKEQRNWTHLA